MNHHPSTDQHDIFPLHWLTNTLLDDGFIFADNELEEPAVITVSSA